MIRETVHALAACVVTFVLCAVAYPAAVWGLGQLAFPQQAEGSLIYSRDRAVIGSELIAQPFASDKYFQPRPSAGALQRTAPGRLRHPLGLLRGPRRPGPRPAGFQPGAPSGAGPEEGRGGARRPGAAPGRRTGARPHRRARRVIPPRGPAAVAERGEGGGPLPGGSLPGRAPAPGPERRPRAAAGQGGRGGRAPVPRRPPRRRSPHGRRRAGGARGGAARATRLGRQVAGRQLGSRGSARASRCSRPAHFPPGGTRRSEGPVFCWFLAWVLRQELQARLEEGGPAWAWAEGIGDLDR